VPAGHRREAGRFHPTTKLKVYKGGSHGICTTQKDEVNADLLAFIRA